MAAFCQNEEVAQTPSELMSERVSGSSAVCRCHGLFNRPHGENRGRRKHTHTHTVETGEQRNARARPDTLTAVSDRGGRAYHRRSKADKRSLFAGGDWSCTRASGFGRTGQFLTGLCGLVPQLRRKQNMIARSLEKTSCKEYRRETRNETNCGELLGGEKKGGVGGGERGRGSEDGVTESAKGGGLRGLERRGGGQGGVKGMLRRSSLTEIH